jgi:C4-dicarboxylate-specific signal transduction histidine kinase
MLHMMSNLWNLIGFEAGAGELQVRVLAEPNGRVVEEVDRDRGIRPEDQATQLRPFFRAGKIGTGPGPGLDMVRRAVGFRGVRLELESREDAGTRFDLHSPSVAHLPLDDALLGRMPLPYRERNHE